MIERFDMTDGRHNNSTDTTIDGNANGSATVTNVGLGSDDTGGERAGSPSGNSSNTSTAIGFDFSSVEIDGGGTQTGSGGSSQGVRRGTQSKRSATQGRREQTGNKGQTAKKSGTAKTGSQTFHVGNLFGNSPIETAGSEGDNDAFAVASMPRKRSAKAKRAVDETVRKLAELASSGVAAMQPQFPGVRYPNGQEMPADALRQIWTLEKAELDTICDPICEMLPDLSEAAQDRLARILNPIALIVAGYTITAPRMAAHREIVSYVKSFNAGFVATETSNRTGNGHQSVTTNTGTVASNPNSAQPNNATPYDAAAVIGLASGLSAVNPNGNQANG